MNWKLKFTKSGVYVEFYNDLGKVILTRRFLGFQTENYEDGPLVPKVELYSEEIFKIDGDNIYIK